MLDDVQSVVLSIITSISGCLSVLGSSSIMYMILSDRERKLGRPYHRLMLMMSCFDAIQSLAVAVAPLPLPREDGVYGAQGNSSTCTFQGFLMTLGLAVPLYNSGLNMFYMLTIRYNFSSERFTKYEPAIHATAIIVPFSLAIFYAATDQMRRRVIVCLPLSKLSSRIYGALITANFLICTSTMISICWKVNFQTKKMTQYTYARRNSTSRVDRITKERNETIKQACFYFSVFVLTHTFPIILSLIGRGREGIEPPFTIAILSAIFYPLQGFWNLCFYIRPAVNLSIKTNPNMSFFRVILAVIFDRTMNIESGTHQSTQTRPPSCLTARGNEEGENNGIMTSISTAKLHVETGSALNEEDIVEVISLNNASPCAPDEYPEDQMKSAIKYDTNDKYLSLAHVSDVVNESDIVEVSSAVTEEDIVEVSSVGNATPCQPDGDLEKHNKFDTKSKAKGRRQSFVNLGSVLNDEDLVELGSLCSL